MKVPVILVFNNMNFLCSNLTLLTGAVCNVNGIGSNIGDIEISIPQGSYLGSFLFIIGLYINDLPEAT